MCAQPGVRRLRGISSAHIIPGTVVKKMDPASSQWSPGAGGEAVGPNGSKLGFRELH